ncbi:MAG: transposase [Bacteroidales bacterium]|nr:transposase [Bacteroidales bacterium]
MNATGAVHRFKILNICLTADRLIPSLPDRSVVVMANAAFHQRVDTLKAIRTKGHDVLFLPPYSPNLNPIEKKWMQAKNIKKSRRCKLYQLFQIFLV